MKSILLEQISNTNKAISSFCRDIACKAKYYLPILFFSILGYYFSFSNRTISIDDLNRDFYYGTGQANIAGARWGQALIIKLFSQVKIAPLIDSFIGVLFLFLSSIIICSIFYYLKKGSVVTYSLFSSFFITYPLINEIWVYNEACIPIGLETIIASYIILYILINDKLDSKKYLLLGLCLSVVAAGYEVVMFCYVTIVISILFIKNDTREYNKHKEWLIEGLKYACPFIIAVLFKYIIGFIIIKICNINYAVSGSSDIHWLRDNTSILHTFTKMIKSNLIDYVINGLSYFPIGEYVILTAVFVIIAIAKIKKKNYLILSILLVLSPFLICIVQGNKLSYRFAFPIQYYVSFVAFYFSSKLLTSCSKQSIAKIIIVLLFFTCFRQSIYLNNIFSLNNLRSDNESAIARMIGYDIYSKYDKDKPVVFCGEYHLSNFINQQIYTNNNSLSGKIEKSIRVLFGGNEMSNNGRQFIQTNVNSHLSWSVKALNRQILMKDYLSYYGFDISILPNLSDEEIDNYERIAIKEGMKDFEIKDMGSYLLVYLGPSSSD